MSDHEEDLEEMTNLANGWDSVGEAYAHAGDLDGAAICRVIAEAMRAGAAHFRARLAAKKVEARGAIN